MPHPRAQAHDPVAMLIVNPRSGGHNRRGVALAERLRQDAGTRVVLLEDFRQLEPALREMAASPPEVLFISSGDGTIQFVQTWLAEHSGLPPQRWPLLALLPHGSTNMTAADIGLRHGKVAAQAALIAQRGWRQAAAQVVSRPTVRVANARGGAQHGMFLGAGVLAEATLYCQQAFNRKGVRGQWGPLLTMLKVGAQALLRPAGPQDTERIDRPHRMRVVADGTVMGDGWQVALLATTLHKLVLGARPFWGDCAQAREVQQAGHAAEGEMAGTGMRVSLFGHPVPFLPRWLPVVLYGSEQRRVHESMRSGCAERVELTSENSRLVMDGEEIPVDGDGPVIIERGPPMRYLRA